MKKTLMRLAIPLLVLLVGSPARAGEPTPDESAPKSKWAPVIFKLGADMTVSHESNIYHVQRRHIPLMDVETDPYQRFHGMKGPADWETRLGLDLAWRFKHVSKRAIGVRLRTRQYLLVDNEIANHQEFLLETTFDVSKHDRLTLAADYAPEHFKKNYSNEAFPGISVYQRADCHDAGLTLEYERDVNKKWKLRASITRSRRDFKSPFDARDAELEGWSLSTHHDLSKRVALRFTLEADRTSTDTVVELGIPMDRSHSDDRVALDLDFNLHHGYSLASHLALSARDFTTGEEFDSSHYGREDRLSEMGIDLGKKLGPRWSLAFASSWASNKANRVSPSSPDDDYGYEDVILGVSAAFKK